MPVILERLLKPIFEGQERSKRVRTDRCHTFISPGVKALSVPTAGVLEAGLFESSHGSRGADLSEALPGSVYIKSGNATVGSASAC